MCYINNVSLKRTPLTAGQKESGAIEVIIGETKEAYMSIIWQISHEVSCIPHTLPYRT